MQFSEHWLRSLVNPNLNTSALAHLLTMAGLEVEEMQPVAPPFSNVVVALVLSTEKHPDADKLKLCQVDVGQVAPLQIVCGAPNVVAGMKVPCALVGAELPGMTIKKAKVRGIESFGMLCSARELGLSSDQDGLLALAESARVGQSIREHLLLDDQLITLKLTPNRADCLSLRGIAREVAALSATTLTLPTIQPTPITHDQQRKIHLDAPAACPHYSGRIIRQVNAQAPTPAWMVHRLERSGLRSISALVDVTNYVMLELGQPLHAFDNAKLTGDIHIRYPQQGEQLKLLNDQQVKLNTDTLIIADQSTGARPLALAGMMGGEETSVTDSSTEIFLESAFFAPHAIAGKARALGFSSDSSYRFERGVDFNLPLEALERASQLILEICGGSAGPIASLTANEHLPKRLPVQLRRARAEKIIGIPLPSALVEKLLNNLGFPWQTAASANDSYIVTPPSYRYDIEIEEDLIEELARLYGYDHIPAPAPQGRIHMQAVPEEQRTPMQLRHHMAERDYQEVVNYSFVAADWEQDFYQTRKPITLANPIASQMSQMRSGLLGGLVNTLNFNLKRRANRVRIFEIGRCFQRDTKAHAVQDFQQTLRIAGLSAGPADPEQWGSDTRKVDFFDVKADVESLFSMTSNTLNFTKFAADAQHPALHPGRSAQIFKNNQAIGHIGELHPEWVQKYELTTAPIVFELELSALLPQNLPQYQEVPRTPAVIRDLALLVDQTLPLQTLLDTLHSNAPTIVQEIQLFDIYQGKGIAENKKSLAFHIVMQDTERTLADADADAAIQHLLKLAAEKCAATLRA